MHNLQATDMKKNVTVQQAQKQRDIQTETYKVGSVPHS